MSFGNSTIVPESMMAGQILPNAKLQCLDLASHSQTSSITVGPAVSPLPSKGSNGLSLLSILRKSESFDANEFIDDEDSDGKFDSDETIREKGTDEKNEEICLACRFSCRCCVCDCPPQNEEVDGMRNGGVSLLTPRKLRSSGLEPFPDFGKSPSHTYHTLLVYKASKNVRMLISSQINAKQIISCTPVNKIRRE